MLKNYIENKIIKLQHVQLALLLTKLLKLSNQNKQTNKLFGNNIGYYWFKCFVLLSPSKTSYWKHQLTILHDTIMLSCTSPSSYTYALQQLIKQVKFQSLCLVFFSWLMIDTTSKDDDAIFFIGNFCVLALRPCRRVFSSQEVSFFVV